MKAVHQWLGWTETPEQIFQKIVYQPLETIPQRRLNPLTIDFHDPIKDRRISHYGFIFTIGAVNRIIKIYDADKSALNGLKHTFLAAFAAFFNTPTKHREMLFQFNAEMEANHQPLKSQQPLGVICSVTESLLWGINPFQGNKESNQFYSLTYCIPAWLVVALLPLEVKASWIPPHPTFFNQPTSHFSITPKTENSFFLDGEFFSNKPGEIINIRLDPHSEITMISHF